MTLERHDVSLAVQGDDDAFERLYRASVSRVHSLARRMAGEDLADDLTQEVFIRAWEKLSTFRGDSSFNTWLHRLAVNLILSRRETIRRRQGRQLPSDGVLETMPARRQSPGLGIDLESALNNLPDGARQVFVLYDVEGYSHEEIAGIMGITTGTSKSQLHRARMILRSHLN